MQDIDTDNTFIEEEQINSFNCYCTFVMLVVGKKLNYVNIFIQTISNKYLMKCLRLMLAANTDFDALQYFLQQAPSVIKSKHVTKAINKLKMQHFI